MPKQKKNSRAKTLADKRRETSNAFLYTLSPQTLMRQPKAAIFEQKTTGAIATNAYQHLLGDLRKTSIFTASIILAELLIYYFTKGV